MELTGRPWKGTRTEDLARLILIKSPHKFRGHVPSMIYRLLCFEKRATMYQILRAASACLAILIGAALIGRLWLVALDAVSLGNAAYGLIFLLLALGLMGHQRLSLALTTLACIPAFLSTSIDNEISIVLLGQYLLFGLCVLLFTLHPTHRKSEEA